MRTKSKCKEIKQIIAELFRDGEVHTIEELSRIALERGVITDRKDSAVKNALYQTKKNDINFMNIGMGQYQLKKSELEDNQAQIQFDEAFEIVFSEIRKISTFDWMNCSTDEFLITREKILRIKELYVELQRIIR